MLVEIAHVAAKTKDTYLAAQYRRIVSQRGKKRALIALGHTVLVIAYQLLTRKQPYHDLGVAYFDKLDAKPSQTPVSASAGAHGLRGRLAAECHDGLSPLFSAEYPFVS